MDTSRAGEPGLAVVVGAGRGIGRDLFAALAERGRPVAGVSADAIDLADPEAVRASLEAGADGRPIDVVVIAHLEPDTFRAAPLTEVDEQGWEDTAERSLRAGVVVLQQVHAVVPDGARVVLVLPTSSASGVPGLVPLCTAVEGLRVMAKAVARRWGQRDVTLNTIEVDLAAFVLGDGGSEDGDGAEGVASLPAVAQLGTPALAPASAVADVVGLVELLASDGGGALTGALLVADRGTVMQP